MPKRNAPIKSVSGQPFGFETRVGAQMLVHLLTGVSVLDSAFGRLMEVKFYQRSAGWGEFDDLLLIFEKDDAEIRCGLSLKTDGQLTKNGAKRDLVNGAWDVFLHFKNAVTDPEHYFLGLVAAPQPHDVSSAFTETLRLAVAQRPGDFEQQVQTGEGRLKRAIYDSFAPSVDQNKGSGLRAGDLLKRFVFQEYDFGNPQSKDEGSAINFCRTTLSDGLTDSAEALWRELARLSDECRQSGGSYDLQRLVAKLRSKFSLKEHPDFAFRWSQLAGITSLNLEQVRDQIGEIRLPRSNLVTSLEAARENARLIVLYGAPGSGKSSLACRLVKDSRSKRDVGVFLRGGELGSEQIQAWIRRSDPETLFSTVHSKTALLAIDGVEACRSDEAWRRPLKKLLDGCILGQEDSPWQVILTCRTLELDGFLSELAKRAPEVLKHCEFVEVDLLTRNEVLNVIGNFPLLAVLARHPRVIEVLRNAKILEVVVARLVAASVQGAEEWVGETSVIDWWWREVVLERKPLAEEGRTLINLGIQLAAQTKTELPSGSVDGEISAINRLIDKGILAQTEGRVRFAHDLYSDWSRMRALLEMGSDASKFLPTCVEFPQWHHAIRLVGAHLLETPTPGHAWRRLMNSLPETGSASLLTRDLLLESVVFTSAPLDTLEAIRHDLTANGGELLKRFLVRFQHTATVPDPRFLDSARSSDPRSLSQLGASLRLPYGPFWPPILDFIEQHIEEVAVLAPSDCARIAKLWLQLAELVQISGQPAAFIAVRVAQTVAQRELSRDSRVKRGTAKIAYGALLGAARELPDEVSALVLKLAGRRRWDLSELSLPNVDPRFLGRWETDSSWIPADEIVDDPPQSWPDGPTASTLHDFQEVLLDPLNVNALLDRRPEVPAEALLAVLIAWPKSWPRTLHGFTALHHGFQFVHRDFPPRYWKTPFLFFLRRCPEHGLQCLIKLVNFATDRACEQLQFEFGARPIQEIELNGAKTVWLGNQQIFAWYNYPMITVHTVGSALMAFERWLYEELDAGRSVDATIETILQGSRSLAFLGVLLTVAKKFPRLLLGPLRPLLFIRDLYLFDLHAIAQYGVNGPSMNEARWEQEATRQWQEMHHRRLSLHDLSLQKFLKDPEWQDLFSKVRALWISNANSAENDPERLEWLRWAAKFDRANWSMLQQPDGIEYRFELPKELQDQEFEKLHAKRKFLLSTPFQCRQLLSQETKLNSDELDRLWSHLQEVAEWDDSSVLQGDEVDILSVADVVCGYIAVLVISHIDWLHAHPNRLKWCRDRLLQIIEVTPPLVSYTEEDALDRFDDFASQAIVELWAEEPGSVDIRAAVARLALSFRYRTVALLSAQAGKLRDRLGQSWLDLESLLLRWSAARLSLDRDRFRGVKTFDFDAWRDQWFVPFVENRISKPPATWKEIAVPEKRRKRTNPQREIAPYWPDINIRFLLAVYNWIPPLDEASSDAERKRWIDIGQAFLDATVRRFEITLESDDHFDGVPNRTDLATFRFISRILLDLREDEDPRQFWFPMLRLGPRAHYWIHYFLTEFILLGLNSEPISQKFIRRWRVMLEFALSERAWTESQFWQADEAWEHLFGFDSVTASAWIEERRAVIQEIKTYYWRWLRDVANRSADVLPFLRFLQCPAAQHIVCESLPHLERCFTNWDEHFWKDRHYRQPVSSFMELLWSHHYEQIKSSADLLQIFRFLVSLLAAHQDPLALEIIALIGGSVQLNGD